MHRNNKRWKMKWGQNLLSLKYQRSLPVGFGGSKTVGRDRIVADTWHSLMVLFGSEEEGNRLSTGRVQPQGSRTALTGAAGPGQGTWHSTSLWLGHSQPHLDTRTNRHGHATGCDLLGPRGGKTYTNKRVILALAAPIPCPALQVKTYTQIPHGIIVMINL